MSLGSDPVLPLVEGGEDALARFVEVLRRHTGAWHVELRLGDHAVLHHRAGYGVARIPASLAAARFPWRTLRNERPYASEEFAVGPAAMEQRDALIALGLADERMIRTGERHPAWLAIGRDDECSAADSALLSRLAPYLAAAVARLAMERIQQSSAVLSNALLNRVGACWVEMDASGRTIAQSDGGLLNQAEQAALGRNAAGLAGAGPHLVVLQDNPRKDALIEASPSGGWVAYLRDHPRGGIDPGQLAKATPLSFREAQFAALIGQGFSIAESGKQMGLTLETARHYSRVIYAKLEVTGQPHLMRWLAQSSASLSQVP